MGKNIFSGTQALGLWIPVISCLFILASKNYLLFHIAAEGFAITVAAMIYILATKTYKYSGNNFLLFLAYPFAFVAVLDFLHMITYYGMNVFYVDNKNIPTQLWVAGRFIQASALFLAPFFIRRRFSIRLLVIGYGLATSLLIIFILWFQSFPVCFAEGQGLTTFKILSEYLVSLVILSAIVLLYFLRDQINPQMRLIMTTSMAVTILSEISFTLYQDPYGVMNFIGHICKVVSYYLIYWGIVLQGIQRPYDSLSSAYNCTLEGWAKALELRDHETRGHSNRVTEITLRLAAALGIKETDLINVARGALLHDIGKIGIPDSILLKPGRLTAEERVIIEKHPEYGYNMLMNIDYLSPALDIVRCHHEKWDGTGYPKGLKGDEIPLAAQLFSLADTWDALNSDRPYRPAWPRELVVEYIKEEAGKQFSPHVVRVFLDILKSL